MSIISIRVPKDLKERMSRVQEDWAEYIRNTIERRIKERQRVEASETIDRIRSKTKKGAYQAATTVRKDRDRT